VDRRAAKAFVECLLPMWLPFDHAVDREWNFGLSAACILPFPASQTDHDFPSSIQKGKVRKLSTWRRCLTTYPYQAFNEVCRWVFRSIQYWRLRFGTVPPLPPASLVLPTIPISKPSHG
jgi:glycosyl transferase, family 25